MWGGGVIEWDNTGVGEYIITQSGGDLEANEETAQQLENAGGPIKQAVNSIGGGPLIAIWNFVVQFVGALFWPITVLQSVNAPPRIIVLLGGSLSVAFIGAFITLIRGSG